MEIRHNEETERRAIMLKALMLRKKIDAKKKELEALRAKEEGFVTREAELEEAITEAAENAEKAETDKQKAEAEEAQKVVEDEVEAFEAERSENSKTIVSTEAEIADMERELDEVEQEQEREAPVVTSKREEKKEVNTMPLETRGVFGKMDVQTRDALFQRDDVKGWIGEIRAHIAEKRDLTNVGLTIPEVFIGFLRENVLVYSKLYRHCNVQSIGGAGREVIMGSVPEAIWTECCATLNELDLRFNDAEVDCFKVGGYFKVCNAVLQDSDIALASILLDAIGQAIGLALDKAILYGRNTTKNQKMPLGVVSRLVQTEVPSGYPATARPWTNLSVSNVRTIADSVTGIGLFQQLTVISGAIKGKYARGEKVWVMNETTYTFLKAQAMSINAAGAIVSSMEGTMPVIGGIVEVLDFLPDYVIVGGYFELYLLAERGGTQFAQSEHAFFIEDATAFRGTARYDGQPVIAEAFAVIGINGVTPDSTMAFAPDEANGTPITSPTVAAETGALWEVPNARIQSGITVANNYITGTSKWLSGSNAITDVWGEGNFIALKFSDFAETDIVKVGIVPTQGAGMQELDEDKNALFKIFDKNTQVIKVVTSNGKSTKTDLYYLGGLTCQTA